MPEAGKVALEEIADGINTTVSKYLREFFVIYLYGMHELLRMQALREGLYYVPPPKPVADSSYGGVRYSRAAAVEYIPGLGKNIFPVKLYLHERVKDDLQKLADQAGVPLSQFTREILISHFFGHTFWPEKLKNWSDSQEWLVVEWEQKKKEGEFIMDQTSIPDEIDSNSVLSY